MNVRALVQAATVETVSPPYNTIHLKVFYPAKPSERNQEQHLYGFSVDSQHAPFKVVILLNGVNCGPELYQWLAVRLAVHGLVVVTFSWVAENFPGAIALTPGVDLRMLTPSTYGTGPTASALPTLLTGLERLQSDGILAGLLDLDHIVLGGHSAGGRVAIESADPNFFPQVTAAFAYGSHSAAVTYLGYSPGTILALPDSLPLLLMGGTCDGVIANSSYLYGVTWEHPTTPVERTFREAIVGGRGDSYLLLFNGGNHFSMIESVDSTIGSTFLDFPATQPQSRLRHLMAESIRLFIEAHVCGQTRAIDALHQQLVAHDNDLVALFENK